MRVHDALTSWFGHSDFRPHQREIVENAVGGRDTLAVLPTGAGKSICYQLPAMLLDRPTVVVSPLIALMKDQLDGLPADVYPHATLINSTLERDELERRLVAIEAGRVKLIYAAPERLRQARFLDLLERVGPALVVVDEAHCVSVWDFRPDYLFIRKALERLSASERAPTLLALTATATPAMRTEIASQLGRSLESVVASSFRPNLTLEVRPCRDANDKICALVEACKSTPGATIVYATSRDRCEMLADLLRKRGVQAAHYHAGLEREERRDTQERFMLDRVRVIVATVAFGMGIDKANVRMVAHFSPPHSLEAYTQEAGRAGRDGRPSRCLLLHTSADRSNLTRWMNREQIDLDAVKAVYRALEKHIPRGATGKANAEGLRIEAFPDDDDVSRADTRTKVSISLLERCGLVERHPDFGGDMRIEMLVPPKTAKSELVRLLEERRRQAKLRLDGIAAYTDGASCRHLTIARHFGQVLDPCNSVCDRCLGTVKAAPVKRAVPTAAEVPDIGRAILETVVGLPYRTGRTGLAKVLAGAPDVAVQVEDCPNFRALSGLTLKTVRGYVDELLERGMLQRAGDDERPLAVITEPGREALRSDVTILPNPNVVRRAVPAAPAVSVDRVESEPGPVSSEDESDRFERLRAWRRARAQHDNVPPYVVFSDETLRALAHRSPTSLGELNGIRGIGPAKIERYGQEVIELLGAAE